MSSRDGTQPEVFKLFYRIGEVARIAGVDPSVLRHWETEFRGLRPGRSTSGQRTYSQSDVRKILEIKHLLHERKFTTKGAISVLRAKGKEPLAEDDPVLRNNDGMRETLLQLRQELLDFMAVIERTPEE
jgi:DNA-binding transcriptional MerR regulator